MEETRSPFVVDIRSVSVSVVLQDQFSETDNSLMIGHAALCFPYRMQYISLKGRFSGSRIACWKFKNRTELSDYLMLKYDNSWGQDTAHTFIMENPDLMDGWRILDEQKDAS